MKKPKNVAILGSTGSIGTQALSVIRKYKNDFKVFSLAAHSNIELLKKQVQEFSPKMVVVFDEEKANLLQKQLSNQVEVKSKKEGLIEAVQHKQVDIVLLAMTGVQGLQPAIEAIEAKKQIALANKELLVCAGHLIMDLVKKNGVDLIPVDSEHSALFQCLQGQPKKSIRKMIITASGGPFRFFSKEQLASVTIKEALNHPNWNMGPKNTVDSSTLLNKGLEMIEACHLFDLKKDQIEAVIHPTSIVHGLVEFSDGSILAQMAKPNMILPIQYALTYPERKPTALSSFDFTKSFDLKFFPPDLEKFPCLDLSYSAIKIGRSMPCFMNAANEILVDRFLKGEIQWLEIGKKLKKLMTSHEPQDVLNLGSIFLVDRLARERAKNC